MARIPITFVVFAAAVPPGAAFAEGWWAPDPLTPGLCVPSEGPTHQAEIERQMTGRYPVVLENGDGSVSMTVEGLFPTGDPAPPTKFFRDKVACEIDKESWNFR
jgi:hypothetical protein